MSNVKLEKESEELLNKLEVIYLKTGWRNNKNMVKREAEIKKRLSEILAAA